jgi:hypothetical protein
MTLRDDFDRLAYELTPFWAADNFSALCERNVQSLSAMTRDELEGFLESTARASAHVRLVQPGDADLELEAEPPTERLGRRAA